MHISISKTSIPNEGEKAFIFHVWNSEYPERLAFKELKDLDVYLSGLKNPSHYFAKNESGHLMAWAATFERDEEKWLAMILDTMAQRKGLGSALLKTISNQQGDLNGWVIDHDREIKQNGSPYLSPINFYVKNNFVICSSVRLETEKISAVKIKWNYNHNV